MSLANRVDPRVSRLPVLFVFLAGLLAHGVDQMLHFRAGPVPLVVVSPAVSVLAYLHVRPETRPRWLVVLLCWGAVGSGVAVIGVYLVATSYRLPRPMSEPELVLFDLGLFLWFVLSLAGVYALAARSGGRVRRGLDPVLFGPVLQFAWILVVIGAFEAGQLV